MIKTVIFDIGNVLMRFSWWDYILKVLDEETADIVTDCIWRHNLWNELDHGIQPVDEVFEQMIAVHPEYRDEVLKVLDGVGQACHHLDYSIPWIQELKAKGYQVLFLSNYSDWLISKNPEVLDFLPYLDGGVFSSHVKQIKPGREIYQTICDTYHLNPAECLFVDDNAANVAAAEAFGLNTVHFLGYDQSYQTVMQKLAESKDR